MFRELRETSGCKGCLTVISSTWTAVHHSSYAVFSPDRISPLIYLKYLCIELAKQWINTFILYPRLHSFVEGIVSFRFLLSLFSFSHPFIIVPAVFPYLLLHTIVFYSFVARMWGKTESIVWMRYIQTVQKDVYGFSMWENLFIQILTSPTEHTSIHTFIRFYVLFLMRDLFDICFSLLYTRCIVVRLFSHFFKDNIQHNPPLLPIIIQLNWIQNDIWKTF